MSDPKEKPETTQDTPSTDDPDFDITAPDIEYVQNDYKPDIDKKSTIIYEEEKKNNVIVNRIHADRQGCAVF